MFDTIYGFGFRYVLWKGHLNVACLLLSYDWTKIHCVEQLALGKVPRITLKAPHWDCGTDITCIWSVSLLRRSILPPYSTLNPYSYYLLLLHTYLLQGGTPVWSVNCTWNLGEILVDVIYSRRTETNKRETTLHAARTSKLYCMFFYLVSFSFIFMCTDSPETVARA